MLVFDEKKYAEDIIKNKAYNTIKNQGKERCIIARYLHWMGLSNNDIIKELSKIPMAGGEYLSEENKISIFTKIVNKALDYEFIYDKEVLIYQDELDTILTIENDDAQNLLFIYLVYYKWARQNNNLKFYSKKNQVDMVVENNIDIWKLANVAKLRVSERYRLNNMLYNLGLYKIDNFKSHNYIYLPFIHRFQNEGTLFNDNNYVMKIDNYDNILGEFLLYKYPEKYKRCECCNIVIQKTRSPKKYCDKCSRNKDLEKKRRWKNKVK